MALLAALPAGAQQVASYKTNADLTQRMQQQPSLSFSSNDKTGADRIAVMVDPQQRFQTIDGFGGSITDGTSWLLETKLTRKSKNAVMAALFDPHKGIGLSFLRQPLGATDLSRAPSTYDDMPVGEEDRELKHFSIAQDQPYTLPLVKQALKINPAITVMVTPWSAPAWMKENRSLNGGHLRDETLPFYAQYLARSVEAYQAAGVPIKYLTIQNEPLYSTKDYPGAYVPAEQAARLIGSYLGEDLRKAGLRTQILAYDHNWDHPEYPLSLLADSKVAPYLAGSALHCYGGDVAVQEDIHKQYPDKGIWMTECSGGTWDKEPALIKTSRLLIESSRHWARAVSLWGLVLDSDHNPHSGGCGTCRGLVTLDLHKPTPEVSYTGDYYALGHASKFVSPGAVRIASPSQGEAGVQTVAFQNRDHSVVLIVLNNQDHNAGLSIHWLDKTFETTLEPLTLATYIWKP